MAQATCETCRFWVFFSQSGTDENNPPLRFGHCQRYPPHAQSQAHEPNPITRMTHWCGEHQPKESTTAR